MQRQQWWPYVLGLIITLTGCFGTYKKTEDILQLTIYHYKIPCAGEGIKLCYSIKKEKGAPELFYDAIEGFNYQWGYNYTLLVQKRKKENPMADAGTFTYILKKVLKKEKVPARTIFTLPVQWEGQSLITTKDKRCWYMNTIPVETSSFSTKALTQAQTAVFHHHQKTEALVLVAIQ